MPALGWKGRELGSGALANGARRARSGGAVWGGTCPVGVLPAGGLVAAREGQCDTGQKSGHSQLWVKIFKNLNNKVHRVNHLL